MVLCYQYLVLIKISHKTSLLKYNKYLLEYSKEKKNLDQFYF